MTKHLGVTHFVKEAKENGTMFRKITVENFIAAKFVALWGGIFSEAESVKPQDERSVRI